jgi:hypothetical protein
MNFVLSWLGLRAARAFGLCFCIFAFACVLCKSCSGIGLFFLFFLFLSIYLFFFFPFCFFCFLQDLTLLLFLLLFFFVLFAFFHSVPLYVHDGFLLHLCVYIKVLLRCAASFVLSLSTYNLDWSAEGLQKIASFWRARRPIV